MLQRSDTFTFTGRFAFACGSEPVGVREPLFSVCELFSSIQGETSYVGKPCNFVRFTGCNLRCHYCDTRYALSPEAGEAMTEGDIVERLHVRPIRLTCLTGGEPMLQPGIGNLCERLLDLGHTVLVETNGTISIRPLPRAVIKIVDVKIPGTYDIIGTTDPMRALLDNLVVLDRKDELKFVISGRRQYVWARDFVRSMQLTERFEEVLFSPAWELLDGSELVSWVLDDGLDVRINGQLHKVLWGPSARGV